MKALAGFLDETARSNDSGGIPTGIISTGPDAYAHASIIEQLSRKNNPEKRRNFVSLSASTGANLKALLKAIIQKATARNEGIDDEDEDEVTTHKKGAKLLNYDLQILADYVRERGLQQVVLSIQDTEAFDSDLLSEVIELLGFWQDRIPFVCLFNIATSVEFLQARLTKGAVRCLKGRLFDVANSMDEIEQVFEAVTHPDSPLWIGANLMSSVLERQRDYIQSIDSFVEAVRYAYMSCYYANALSVFLNPNIKSKDVPADHVEAAQNVDSFREFCRKLLEKSEVHRLRSILDSKDVFLKLVTESVREGREALASMKAALIVLQELQRHVQGTQVMPKSKLYNQAMTNKLNGSTLIRSLLLSIRKTPSNTATEIMDAVTKLDLPEDVKTRCSEIQKELSAIVKGQSNGSQPLRSEDDLQNSTLRTTVVAQKVELSKQKSTLSKQDAAYTAILRQFTDLLEDYFNKSFVDPKSLLFHEILIYDLKSPHKEVFTPRPRHAVERALAAPHDYLDCDCCAPGKDDGDEATLAASQPATAVLYQLYLESGSLINASDLWQAFQAVMGDDKTEEQNMALFQRALAELRYLGLVKGTRKRVDHVAKVAWRGL